MKCQQNLATNAKDIKFINRDYENPIFAQITDYLNSYIRFAISQKEQEVVFRAAQVYTDLALIALEKKLSTPLFGIQQQLYTDNTPIAKQQRTLQNPLTGNCFC